MRHLLTVADVMTTDVVTVAENTSFKAVASTLAEHHISAVPVCSAHGAVAGVVSETDLLRKEEYQGWLFAGAAAVVLLGVDTAAKLVRRAVRRRDELEVRPTR